MHPSGKSSLVYGAKYPPLWHKTLGQLVHEQAEIHGDRTALVVPWQSICLSYCELAAKSKATAKAILAVGLQNSDCIGIMAGNCHEYIEIFVGAARIGCPVVVLNNTYTPSELRNAVVESSCKLVFIAANIAKRDIAAHLELLRGNTSPNAKVPELQLVISLGGEQINSDGVPMLLYSSFVGESNSSVTDDCLLRRAEDRVFPDDVLSLQFTSGTTGTPKAAMLTHNNILNNARCVGDVLNFVPQDVVCCPPPLFHCFGLVLGFHASLVHGCTLVLPSDNFDARMVVESTIRERATVLLGVPTMFLSELDVLAGTNQRPRTLRAGIVAGAAVSPALMHKARERMGLENILIAYGMTETSPTTFMTQLSDTDDKLKTIGKAMPHLAAKIIDQKGDILPMGQSGELCISGYALQKGYWRNEEKTAEVMKRDDEGVVWIHTGDTVSIDDEGYAHITGRIKDIIIRGGENIFPREIEERLALHPAVSDVSVVGLKDKKYGEVVGSFLKQEDGIPRPSDGQLREFVSKDLGWHKAPRHVFWVGDLNNIGDEIPKTGSGKHQKHLLQKLGDDIVRTGIKARI